MTLVIILNVVFVTLLLVLLAGTMRLPFLLRSGEHVQVRARQRRVARARHASQAARPALGGTGASFASD
jgi:hypothetical protein